MADNLNSIANEVRKCSLCRLCESRTTAVPGEGSSLAKLMLIGEAPGRNEDWQGRPFVGAAGKLLTEALEKAGLSRNDVFITNVVKCRPLGNRVPTERERESCKPYLERQIKLINPRIICILGRTAYEALLKGGSIISNRGKLIRYKNRYYFLTVHPAAVIYNPQLRSVFNKDIVNLIDALKKLESKKGSLEEYI
ncbi:MAG: uracil-DNA glycosylase family protein [Nitrososphaerales archaeon]